MGYFFLLLLLVLGYFALFAIVMSRARNKRAIYFIGFSVLVAYASAMGMIFLMNRFLGELGLVIYGVAIIYSLIFWSWKLYRTVQLRPRINFGALLTFVAYILAVLYITSFVREEGSHTFVQMEVFNFLQEDAHEDINHILLNIAMFVPVGVLYPYITEGIRRKTLSSISFGVLFTVLIETGQLILQTGTCDVDDIITNTAGAAIGALVVNLWSRKVK